MFICIVNPLNPSSSGTNPQPGFWTGCRIRLNGFWRDAGLLQICHAPRQPDVLSWEMGVAVPRHPQYLDGREKCSRRWEAGRGRSGSFGNFS